MLGVEADSGGSVDATDRYESSARRAVKHTQKTTSDAMSTSALKEERWHADHSQIVCRLNDAAVGRRRAGGRASGRAAATGART